MQNQTRLEFDRPKGAVAPNEASASGPPTKKIKQTTEKDYTKKNPKKTYVQNGYCLEDQPQQLRAPMVAIDRLIKSEDLWPGFFGRYMNALDTCTFLVKSKYDRAPELHGLAFHMLERAFQFGGIQEPSGKSSYVDLVAYLKQNMPPLKKQFLHASVPWMITSTCAKFMMTSSALAA